MAVYLDPMVGYGKRIGRAGPLWCHMIADSLDELHAMANRIGLLRRWFQPDGSAPHYDLGTQRKRFLAVAHGAIECERNAFVAHMRRIRKQKRGGKCSGCGYPVAASETICGECACEDDCTP